MGYRATFFGIEIAKTGLMIGQKGLDVTGHNIANVDTAGYTRQRLNLSAREPFFSVPQFKPIGEGRLGAGVRVVVLDQIRDAFLDRQFRREYTMHGEWSTRVQGLTYIEALLEGDETANLSITLNRLFNAFNDLAKEPYDTAQRVVVKSAAEQLCADYAKIHSRLLEMQREQELCVEATVARINTLTENIGRLNKHIYFFELDGQPANDLRDQRNLLLDELSSLIEVDYSYRQMSDPAYASNLYDNQLVIKVGDVVLVDHVNVTKMETLKQKNPVDYEAGVSMPVWGEVFNSVTGEVIKKIEKDPSTGLNIMPAVDVRGGKLKGHIDLMMGTGEPAGQYPKEGIPFFVERINTMARALVQELNKVHSAGYTHASDPRGSVTGTDFFNMWNVDKDAAGYRADDASTWVYVYELSKINAGNLRLTDEIAARGGEFAIAASTEVVSFYQEVLNVGQPGYDENDESTWILGAPDPTKLKSGNQDLSKALYSVYDISNISINLTGAPDGARAVGSLNGFVASIVIDIAVSLNHAKNMTNTQATLLLATENQRISISGVSLDEEMTHLIRYQHAYQGASRVVTAMDEALETIINRMGLVGRS